MEKTRLDIYLARNHPRLSRTEIKRFIEKGFVSVDGKGRKPGFLLKGGEKIELRWSDAPKREYSPPEAEEIPIEILYEDHTLLIVNKPAGMVVHPAAGNYSGTLVNALMWHFKSPPSPSLSKRGIEGGICPGLVHRLDKGTSGVMVIAKTDEAHRALSTQFKKREIEKTYLALVFGRFPRKEGVISFAMGRDPVHRRKFSSRARHKREAVTHYQVVKEFEGLTLLKVTPKTGRTHQIRVHLSEAHHPIAGDTTYGAKPYLSSIKDESLRAALESLGRPFLHALRLSLIHPSTGKRVEFSAPLPRDLESILQGLHPEGSLLVPPHAGHRHPDAPPVSGDQGTT